MSIKIYAGLISTTSDVFELRDEIAKCVEPIFKEKLKEAAAEAAANVGKKFADVFILPQSFSAGQNVISTNTFVQRANLYDVIESLRRYDVRTFSSLDFGYQVNIMPNGRGEGHNPLILVNSESPDYLNSVKKLTVVEEYPYWDNSDKPDEITSIEWLQRREAWDAEVNDPFDRVLAINQISKYGVAAWK